ncbi:carboxypeptidase-like regulatory domain-containing protein [Cytophagaceae bacterium 50C-KIRBA]|uniref:Carboxypeptidase-like regulatory domain-containing protein n=1 Tax=Aquirufa beregesia TaxID=2516556 RepID=A0ABX0EXD7_9BACT|nr:DUF5686 and carboxypeptidase-like regulatory domain-containing protein [Aquirufa beregesia]NGZ45251.1 carboxypeptidase-like regulatory domain-containing protein [Aquirufa beregesia]
MNWKSRVFLALLILLVGVHWAQAQYVIKGRVTDASNGDPVPFASVGLVGLNLGTTTNFQGEYTFHSKVLTDSLFVSFVGYKKRVKFIDKKKAFQEVDFQMDPAQRALQEVIVYSGENPAFKILRQVVKQRDVNDRNKLSAYEYDSYTKMELDVDNISEKLRNSKIMREIESSIKKFEKEAGEDGKPVIPTYISESISKFYYRESPKRKKEKIIKTNIKGVGVQDGGFISQLVGGNLIANYNFYQNYVPFFGKDFASPIGDNWKGNYKFFLGDTVNVDGHVCYQLDFDPKNAQDLVFTGQMWIDTTSFALVQIDAAIDKQANLNFIDKIKISQELEQVTDGAWLPSRTRFLIDIEELTKGSAGMLLKMYISNKGFVVNRPKPLEFYDLTSEVAEDAKEPDPEFWKYARYEPLSRQDLTAFALIDSVKNLPIVRTYVEIAEIALSGYKKFNDIEVGPYLSSIAVNRLEGARFRLGFRTNSNFDKHWILRGNVGFGTRDLVPKYSIEVNYLFSKAKWTIAGLRHSYDIERVGLTPELIGDNRLFYAFTRWGAFSGAFFRRESEAFFSTEVTKGLSFTAQMNTRSFDPLFRFQYRLNPELGNASPVQDYYQESFVTLEARFAKGETFIMNGNERITLATKRIPVVTFRYQRGFKGFLGGDFNYERFTLKAYQTFRLGTFGRSDYTLSLGYTPSNLPAPLLFPHLGNETLFFVRSAFSTMNYFEFVSDQFVSLQYNHNFEGLLFNRIPLIKKLKWRFIASGNLLWGSQRKENKDIMKDVNNPLKSKFLDMYSFDSLNPNVPYAEVGYGIDNIFKLFRIQAFHRLSYMDHGSPKAFRLMASVNFSF